MIYIVNGYPGSGKTTFEDIVQDIMSNQFAFKISTIDFVKDIATQCGWDGTKDLKNRKFLSNLKDLLTEWDDVPYKKVNEAIQTIKSVYKLLNYDFDKCAIFIDCREPSEIKKFCERLGAKSLLITRPDIESSLQTSNHSDAQVLDYQYDLQVMNDGNLQALYEKALEFIKSEHLYLPESAL